LPQSARGGSQRTQREKREKEYRDAGYKDTDFGFVLSFLNFGTTDSTDDTE
jgi:hypothetical protein